MWGYGGRAPWSHKLWLDGGCWMSPSVCLGAVLKIKVVTPARNGIPVMQWASRPYIHCSTLSKPYTGCTILHHSFISSRTSRQPLVTTNWAAMGNFLYLKHRCPAISHLPCNALYNWMLLVHSVACQCTELLQLMYNKTPVYQSLASHCSLGLPFMIKFCVSTLSFSVLTALVLLIWLSCQ